MILAFYRHAVRHYRRPGGTSTNELVEYRHVLRQLRTLHGPAPAADFGPRGLKAFRVAVIADLGPVGVIEGELAATLAGLLWRRRRVAGYEAAAITAGTGELPPDPDPVEPEWQGD